MQKVCVTSPATPEQPQPRVANSNCSYLPKHRPLFVMPRRIHPYGIANLGYF